MSTDLSETEEGIALVGAVAGDIKPVPEENTSEDCKSCGTKIAHIYCGNCGQKNDDLRRSLWRLIGESLGGLFSFESRMWRTWADLLLKPGKVARAYANGARTIYSPPIRVYIAISFLFFAFVGISNTNFLSFELAPRIAEQVSSLNEVQVSEAQEGQTQNILQKYKFNLYLFAADDKLYKMTEQELEELTSFIQDDEGVKVQIKNNDVDTKQVLNVLLTNPQKFNKTFNTWLPRAMFFMVPIAMLFGWLFIRGKNALLYDHLILAIYIHCVFFLALIIALLLARFVPGIIVFFGLFGVMVYHLLVSLRKMFLKTWTKTVLTTIGTGFLYSLFLLIILVSISTYSIIQAVTDAGLVA